MQPGGVIIVAAFLIFSFIFVVQIVIFEKNRRKYRKLLDEGYYFIENNLVWRRNYLRPVHANNIDFSDGTARIINPSLVLN
ncbi:hypothetical protein D910_02107 [Dendroctonus ponderosae]|uniref:Uncharacterized protein n=1 Tax=Dendroctonus ponderosae TaxID=77166 RepID=U4U3X7_DENPD|nr:hypothetical protein D910_02107 [Dendroctonus ponderosae]